MPDIMFAMILFQPCRPEGQPSQLAKPQRMVQPKAGLDTGLGLELGRAEL